MAAAETHLLSRCCSAQVALQLPLSTMSHGDVDEKHKLGFIVNDNFQGLGSVTISRLMTMGFERESKPLID